MDYQNYGDNAVLITFGNVINEETHFKIVNFVNCLKRNKIVGVLEYIPAYTTITIQYNPLQIAYDELITLLRNMKYNSDKKVKGKSIKIPVCYDATFSVDIYEIISYSGLTKQEIIKIHTSTEYLVYMLGFTPGFFYLGGMDERLYCPRKKNPRLEIEAGSVGIAGSQTGIYSVNSPGGWQLIGKTPYKIFDKTRKENYFLVNQSDRVQFYEISLKEYKKMQL